MFYFRSKPVVCLFDKFKTHKWLIGHCFIKSTLCQNFRKFYSIVEQHEAHTNEALNRITTNFSQVKDELKTFAFIILSQFFMIRQLDIWFNFFVHKH